MINKKNVCYLSAAGTFLMLPLFLFYLSYGNAPDLQEGSHEPHDAALEKLDDPVMRAEKARAGRNTGPRDGANQSGSDGRQAEELPTVRILRLADTISAGTRFSGAVTDDGRVLFSGMGFHGKDKIAGWEDIIQVSACGELFAGLKSDGTVLVANWHAHPAYPVDVSGWKDIVRVSVGSDFLVGLQADGTLVSAGIDGYGETHVDTPEWRDIIAVDTGWQHTVGLDSDGNVHVAGYHSESLLKQIAENPDEWKDITAVSTGGSTGSAQKGSGHIVGLKSDGTVVAVGDDSYGQCRVSGWKDIVAVSAGDYHTVGLTASGEVLTTQNPGQFPDSCRVIARWNEDLDTVSVSAGFGFTLRLKSDGTVEAAGNKNDHQADVADWAGIRLPGSLPSPSVPG